MFAKIQRLKSKSINWFINMTLLNWHKLKVEDFKSIQCLYFLTANVLKILFAVCFNFADLRQIFLLNVWPGKCLEAQCAQTAQTSSCLITPESSEIIHFPSFVYLLIIIIIQLSENLSVEFGTKCNASLTVPFS